MSEKGESADLGTRDLHVINGSLHLHRIHQSMWDGHTSEYNQTQVSEVTLSKCGSLHEAFKEDVARRRALLLPSLEVRGKGAIKHGCCELKQTKQLFSPGRAASSGCFRGDSRQQRCTRGRGGRAARPPSAGGTGDLLPEAARRRRGALRGAVRGAQVGEAGAEPQQRCQLPRRGPAVTPARGCGEVRGDAVSRRRPGPFKATANQSFTKLKHRNQRGSNFDVKNYCARSQNEIVLKWGRCSLRQTDLSPRSSWAKINYKIIHPLYRSHRSARVGDYVSHTYTK